MVLIRSLVFNIVLWVSVLIYAPLSLLTAGFPRSVRYRFITSWSRFALWALQHLCGISFTVSGLEHLPGRPAIVAANHQSAWETLAFQLLFPPQSWVLKRELLWIPLFGWALALTWPIAINRGAGRQALERILLDGKERMEQGRWVVIFPEGTRRPPGSLGRFGLGAARLALHTGRPLVPVAHDAGRYWPRRGFLKYPGCIQVLIGPPIAATGPVEALNERLRNWIRDATHSLQSATPKDLG
ncbi:MAG TPA: lysophospholipid acyltransferase family protein [Acidiferrobacteraceae bacterium]|nr:lysophospholipid acyltransferase family protein [Acidiferrobacteraceae bacterium]